jgi:DeoR/GlpR family transcriptional regulator of sugar metabolism
MLAAQRRMMIRQTVMEHGIVEIPQLMAAVDATRQTVYRDLRALAAAGGIVLVHGGAARQDWSVTGRAEPVARPDLLGRIKTRVGTTAAGLVRPGQTVGISAGTTTLAVARALAAVPGVTVVTNSLSVSHALRGRGTQLVVTGGVPGIVGALLGPIAVTTVRSVFVDWLFLGTNGVEDGTGVTARDLDEAHLHRAWINKARNVAVVADHSKWGVSCLATVLSLREVTALVTDDGMPREAQRLMRRQVRHLFLTPGQEPKARFDLERGDPEVRTKKDRPRGVIGVALARARSNQPAREHAGQDHG